MTSNDMLQYLKTEFAYIEGMDNIESLDAAFSLIHIEILDGKRFVPKMISTGISDMRVAAPQASAIRQA